MRRDVQVIVVDDCSPGATEYTIKYPELSRPFVEFYSTTEGGSAGRARNVGLQKDAGLASKCMDCGKCETHCPQSIQIRAMLKKADKELRPLPYRIAMPIVRKVMSR